MPQTPATRQLKRYNTNIAKLKIDFMDRRPGSITYDQVDELNYMELDALVKHAKAVMKFHKKRDELKLPVPIPKTNTAPVDVAQDEPEKVVSEIDTATDPIINTAPVDVAQDEPEKNRKY